MIFCSFAIFVEISVCLFTLALKSPIGEWSIIRYLHYSICNTCVLSIMPYTLYMYLASDSSVGKECSSVSQVAAVAMSPTVSREEAAKLGPRPTLVICPLSVLSNWQV